MAEDKPVEEITIARMLKLEPEESVKLSEDFLEALRPDDGYRYAAIILTPNTKIIRIIPTESNKVFRVAIDIGRLAPNFLKQIGNLFLDLGLKSLYSTGLCFVEDKCVFNGYIDSSQFKDIDIESLKKEILSIEGITNVDVSVLEIKG